jgi:hypothetical protein
MPAHLPYKGPLWGRCPVGGVMGNLTRLKSKGFLLPFHGRGVALTILILRCKRSEPRRTHLTKNYASPRFAIIASGVGILPRKAR